MCRKLSIFLFLLWCFSLFAQNSKGKFIMHKVVFGESLSKIAKKYGVDTDDILKINPSLTKENINPDQIIRIPNKDFKKDKTLTQKQVDQKTTLPKNKKPHVVQEKETLYSISKKYGVSIEDLVKWNNLKTANLSLGMELNILEPKKSGATKPETKPTIKENPKQEAKPTLKETTTPKPQTIQKEQVKLKSEKLVNKELPVSEKKETKSKVEELVSDETSKTYTSTPDIPSSNNESQKELKAIFMTKKANGSSQLRGTGAPMTTSLGQMETAYVVQHRTLSVGTVIKIKNLVNSKVVYAKVIGKLFDNQDNKNILIRYSLGVKKDIQLLDGKNYIEIEVPSE